MSYVYRQDMIYKPSTVLTKGLILDEMPFPRQPILIKMPLQDIITGLEQMIAGSPGKQQNIKNIKKKLKLPNFKNSNLFDHLGREETVSLEFRIQRIIFH